MRYTLQFPESLPVCERRADIEAAFLAHQVIIVCGETGSGKTTQLPKIALGLGRGVARLGEQRPRMIGHTQPRRIAASSMAKRIAEELKTPLGEVVGFKVRFQDRLAPGASIKLMTDGILLAETQSDPLLSAYDTLIIDEAHERSLNIDFLLGYLRQILPRRPDLKVVVTSATIDADRFAKHFASKSGPAPVLTVSGRLFPVEQRYQPFEEQRDYDLNCAIADAVDQLWANPQTGGDILVFLPGEREIREAADHLSGHLSHHPGTRNTVILPLFARLGQAEQDRVFETSHQRRIVLATNVAETSLTVPGIRFVIDCGTARVKRYSYRSKVEQLLVEPISQAAARQRAGRCGRVANGICIRLYDETDFNGRPAFTDPEILRSSLAGVILRMKSLRLGVVEDFPFIDPPSGRAIADGYQLLHELGAVDERNDMTPMGHELARLPLDPRLGRMIIQARDNQALSEVLVVASALSVQDVRDRPLAAQQQADQAHAKFDDEKSEFAGYVRLWNWIANLRGGPAPNATPTASPTMAPAAAQHKLSNRQYEQQLRANFINVRRLREWRDIHSQLLTVVAEHRWRLNTLPANYEQLHQSLMAGLLGNIGFKSEAEAERFEYLGARGIKFFPHPGAHLSKKPGRWVMCAELVETTRVYARGLASIDPLWIEKLAGHLLKKQVLDPHWEKKTGQVVALERATLYGLVVYSGRKVQYAKVDPAEARRMFIRSALVEGDFETPLAFFAANRKLIAQVQELEHKARRQDVLVDDELIFAFYDRFLPQDVCGTHSLEKWFKAEVQKQPDLLRLQRDELMRHEAAGITTQAFPKVIRLGGADCAVSYLHEPGDPKDGVTATVPLFILNQINEDQVQWLVPGMLKDKIIALLKTLPQRPRSRLVPVPESAQKMVTALTVPGQFAKGGLVEALIRQVRELTGLEVPRTDFKPDQLAAHLFMNFKVVDEHGRQLGTGRQLGALKAQLGSDARGAFAALAQLRLAADRTHAPGDSAKPVAPAKPSELSQGRGRQDAVNIASIGAKQQAAQPVIASERYTAWTFGPLPELLEVRRGGQSLIGFPALIDRGDGVEIEVFDEPESALTTHQAGLRRLFALQIKDAMKYLEKNLPEQQKMGSLFMPLGTLDELRAMVIEVALNRAFLIDPLPTDADGFAKRLNEGRARLTLIANEVARLALAVLLDYHALRQKIKDSKGATDAVADVQTQLGRLMGKRFLLDTAYSQLAHYPRYLKAMTLRLDKLRADPQRDATKLAELRPLDQRFWRRVQERKGQWDSGMTDMRWLLEELRVSFFAQELKTPYPVSVKRLEKAWTQLEH